MVRPDWIAVDWGTSRLRAWAMAGGQVLEALASDKGMGALTPDGFEPALLELAGGWLDGAPPVIACGMVGARTGWAEAEYRAVPCTPLDPARATRPDGADPRLPVLILPGLSQSSPPDVMRGEETQLAGLAARLRSAPATVCTPGTHSKWVTLDNGTVTGFTTFMTGEAFALFAERSVLRHSVDTADTDSDAFCSAVAEMVDRPGAAQVARLARSGDVVLTLGAGDITMQGPEILDALASASTTADTATVTGSGATPTDGPADSDGRTGRVS